MISYNEFGEPIEILRKVSNGEESVLIFEKDNDVLAGDGEEGTFICDVMDPDKEDKIDEYEEEWHEVHWDKSDWADWYGCDEDEVDDAMDDDIKDYY